MEQFIVSFQERLLHYLQRGAKSLLYIHVCGHPKLRDSCTRAGKFAYCTMFAREQMRWIFFFFFFYPTLSRKCFTKNLIYNFNPKQAVSKGWKSSNKLETMKLCVWMTRTIDSTTVTDSTTEHSRGNWQTGTK